MAVLAADAGTQGLKFCCRVEAAFADSFDIWKIIDEPVTPATVIGPGSPVPPNYDTVNPQIYVFFPATPASVPTTAPVVPLALPVIAVAVPYPTGAAVPVMHSKPEVLIVTLPRPGTG